MRLIDTDAMNEKLFYRELGGKDVLITAESVFDMIKASPTAYDVEKVIAEIKRCSGSGYRDIDGDYVPPMIKTETVIDIVKAGGIREQ